MKYLVLGKTGYVAQHFISYLKKNKFRYEAISRSEVDYTHPDELSDYIDTYNIDVVINCTGYTGKPNVDGCELHKEETINGNIVLASLIAGVCLETGCSLIHISSGCIYNNDETDPYQSYTELDPPNFTYEKGNGSFYSGSKALAEREVLNINHWTYVCRLRIPFSNENSNRNYISKLMQYDTLLDAPNSISCLDDFVEACIHLQERHYAYGIYNIVNTEPITAKRICELINEHGISDKQFKFYDNVKDFYDKSGAIARRSNCVLNNDKLLATGYKMRTSEEAIVDALKNWKD